MLERAVRSRLKVRLDFHPLTSFRPRSLTHELLPGPPYRRAIVARFSPRRVLGPLASRDTGGPPVSGATIAQKWPLHPRDHPAPRIGHGRACDQALVAESVRGTVAW